MANPIRFVPGDRVFYSSGGMTRVFTVLSVGPDQQVRVASDQWPRGYSAMFPAQTLRLLERAPDTALTMLAL